VSKGKTYLRYCYATFFLLIGLLLSGCAVGPDYKRTDVAAITPPDWHWKMAEPRDQAPKGNWWEVFQDGQLTSLEKTAVENNQNLRAAVARVDKARAGARLTASEFFPDVTLEASAARERTTQNAPNGGIPFKLPSFTQNSFSVPLDLSYEIDLWGRVRRSFESAQAQAQATVADYQNVLLTLQSDVAVNYFLLRMYDSEVAILNHTIESRAAALEVQNLRYKNGMSRELDFQQAKTELSNAKAQLEDAERSREETSNVLALLCGQPASTFRVAPEPLKTEAPDLPVGLPSMLLERRPDIAEAERTMAARNAEIGVAYAAFFPSVKLTGQGGYLSADTSDLFSWDSHVWSLGPSVTIPILDGGRDLAQVNASRAAYEESVAQYRQSVLSAFKDVEDALLQIRQRRAQLADQIQSVDASHREVELARSRYNQGATTYLEVVDAERTTFSSEQDSTNTRGQLLVATVHLIKALGGGWDIQTPKPEKTGSGR